MSENDSSQVVKASESFFILTLVSSSRFVKSEASLSSENAIILRVGEDFKVTQT